MVEETKGRSTNWCFMYSPVLGVHGKVWAANPTKHNLSSGVEIPRIAAIGVCFSVGSLCTRDLLASSGALSFAAKVLLPS